MQASIIVYTFHLKETPWLKCQISRPNWERTHHWVLDHSNCVLHYPSDTRAARSAVVEFMRVLQSWWSTNFHTHRTVSKPRYTARCSAADDKNSFSEWRKCLPQVVMVCTSSWHTIPLCLPRDTSALVGPMSRGEEFVEELCHLIFCFLDILVLMEVSSLLELSSTRSRKR
jgi:hypothetical protein